MGVEGPVKSPTDEPVAGSGCCRIVGHAFCVELPCRIDRPRIDDVPSGFAVSASERSNEQARPSCLLGVSCRCLALWLLVFVFPPYPGDVTDDAIGTDDLTPFTAAEEFRLDGIADKGCLIR